MFSSPCAPDTLNQSAMSHSLRTQLHIQTQAPNRARSWLRTSVVIFVFRPFSETCVVQGEGEESAVGSERNCCIVQLQWRAAVTARTAVSYSCSGVLLLLPELLYRTVAVACCCYCQNCCIVQLQWLAAVSYSCSGLLLLLPELLYRTVAVACCWYCQNCRFCRR
jgi:hypothetical protein